MMKAPATLAEIAEGSGVGIEGGPIRERQPRHQLRRGLANKPEPEPEPQKPAACSGACAALNARPAHRADLIAGMTDPTPIDAGRYPPVAHRQPRRPAQTAQTSLRAVADEPARLPDRIGRPVGRPFRRRARRGRTDHRPALPVRHARRPHRSGTSATRPIRTRSRTGRRDRIHSGSRRTASRRSPSAESRIRHLRRRPFLHLDLSRALAWRSPTHAPVTRSESRRGDRRRRDDRRHGLGSAQPRGGMDDPNLLVILNDNRMSINERSAACPRCSGA